MGIYETFTKRKKKAAKQGQADVYQYDSLPKEFRVQVVHIWLSAIGPIRQAPFGGVEGNIAAWNSIHDTLAREVGVFNLGQPRNNRFVQCQEYLFEAGTEEALDLIELSFRFVDTVIRQLHHVKRIEARITQEPDEAIDELNHRFREHGIGHQFIGGQLIRVDSQFIHSEVVKPALSLLAEEGFSGASEEFRRAHDHYRHDRHGEAIADALKALESTLKTICTLRRWSYPTNATAAPLIEIAASHGLVPEYLQSVLAAGLPTLRNRMSGHGQGPQLVTIPGYTAAYALHLAASNIVFLVESYRALR